MVPLLLIARTEAKPTHRARRCARPTRRRNNRHVHFPENDDGVAGRCVGRRRLLQRVRRAVAGRSGNTGAAGSEHTESHYWSRTKRGPITASPRRSVLRHVPQRAAEDWWTLVDLVAPASISPECW